jgi:preprotein translocase subunit Sec63
LHTAYKADDSKLFNPYEIMGVAQDATAKEIKSAYRKLTLKYHPDKCDTKDCEEIFNQITKANKALTDEEGRANWEKYGHPDGAQTTSFGVALPHWLFNDERSTFLLVAIVLVTIFIPVTFTILYLQSSKKFTSKGLLVDTISIWGHPSSPVSIKQGHSIHRVVETFSCAAEFGGYQVKKSHHQLLENLMRNLVMGKVLVEGEKLFRKKVEFVRVHFTLLAWLHRMPIAPEFEFNKILKVLPKLMSELIKVASMPRVQRLHYGWYSPAEATVETLQCLVQAVPTDMKKPRGSNASMAKGKGMASLYQLPHMDLEMIRSMAKGAGESKARASSTDELLKLSEAERKDLLKSVIGKDEGGKKLLNMTKMLEALPQLEVDEVTVEVQGEANIVNFDPTVCQAKLRLKRLSQRMAVDAALKAPGKAKEMQALVDRFLSNKGVSSKEMVELLQDIVPAPKLKGVTSMACTPRFPLMKPEKWYFLFGDTKANFVYVNACLELGEAEEAGFKKTVLDAFAAACTDKAKGSNKEEEIKRKLFDLSSQGAYSQVIRMGYVSPPAGTYSLTLQIMCDSYLGADYKFERKVKVDTKARAAGVEASGDKNKPVQNGNGGNKSNNNDTDSSASAQTQLKTSKIKEVEDEDEEATVSSDDEITQAAPSQTGGSCASKGCCPPKAAGAGSDSESEDEVFSDFSYDSEDTGTDIEEEDGTQERKVWTVMPKQD